MGPRGWSVRGLMARFFAIQGGTLPAIRTPAGAARTARSIACANVFARKGTSSSSRSESVYH
jgi:hypothetical protein